MRALEARSQPARVLHRFLQDRTYRTVPVGRVRLHHVRLVSRIRVGLPIHGNTTQSTRHVGIMASQVVIERKPGFPSFGKSVGLVTSSILLSGTLYGIAATNLSPYRKFDPFFVALVEYCPLTFGRVVGGVARPASEFPWWSILVLRAVEILGYASSGFSNCTSSQDGHHVFQWTDEVM